MRTQVRLLVVIAVVCPMVFFLSGCGKKDSSQGQPPAASSGGAVTLVDARSIILRGDKRAREILASKKGDFAEIREWAKGPRHVGADVPKKTMLEIADKLYAAGAVKVYVGSIMKVKPQDWEGDAAVLKEPGDIIEVSASMVAELPDDKTVRQAVIDTAADILKDYEGGNYPSDDLGQKYMLFILSG